MAFYVRELKYIKEGNLPMMHPSFWIFIVIMSQWPLLIVREKIGSGEGNLLRSETAVNGRQQHRNKVGRVKKVEIDSCIGDRFTWVAHFHYSSIEGRAAARMVADTGRLYPPICPVGIYICHGQDKVGIRQ